MALKLESLYKQPFLMGLFNIFVYKCMRENEILKREIERKYISVKQLVDRYFYWSEN